MFGKNFNCCNRCTKHDRVKNNLKKGYIFQQCKKKETFFSRKKQNNEISNQANAKKKPHVYELSADCCFIPVRFLNALFVHLYP